MPIYIKQLLFFALSRTQAGMMTVLKSVQVQRCSAYPLFYFAKIRQLSRVLGNIQRKWKRNKKGGSKQSTAPEIFGRGNEKLRKKAGNKMEKDMRTICRRNCGLCRRSEIAQYVSEPGFSIKQLRDYVENWIGLIRANEHLKESKRLQAERIKVLTDVCSCLSAIGEIIDKETQAQ